MCPCKQGPAEIHPQGIAEIKEMAMSLRDILASTAGTSQVQAWTGISKKVTEMTYVSAAEMTPTMKRKSEQRKSKQRATDIVRDQKGRKVERAEHTGMLMSGVVPMTDIRQGTPLKEMDMMQEAIGMGRAKCIAIEVQGPGMPVRETEIGITKAAARMDMSVIDIDSRLCMSDPFYCGAKAESVCTAQQ